MNDELQVALQSQNKQVFQTEMEKRIKQITAEKVTDANQHNKEIDQLLVFLQQGQNLIPKFIFNAHSRALENARVKISVPKPSFKFSRNKTKHVEQKEEIIDNGLDKDEQTWQLRDAKDIDKEIVSDETRVGLTELENCTVKIIGSPLACCFTNLKKCTVVAPNINGSIHITGCIDCKFLLGCKQLRIHETHNTQFYVNIASGPIIEDCDKVTFAPASESAGPWDQVKDFKWLRAEKSPHWDIIPEAERKLPEYGKRE